MYRSALEELDSLFNYATKLGRPESMQFDIDQTHNFNLSRI